MEYFDIANITMQISQLNGDGTGLIHVMGNQTLDIASTDPQLAAGLFVYPLATVRLPEQVRLNSLNFTIVGNMLGVQSIYADFDSFLVMGGSFNLKEVNLYGLTNWTFVCYLFLLRYV